MDVLVTEPPPGRPDTPGRGAWLLWYSHPPPRGPLLPRARQCREGRSTGSASCFRLEMRFAGSVHLCLKGARGFGGSNTILCRRNCKPPIPSFYARTSTCTQITCRVFKAQSVRPCQLTATKYRNRRSTKAISLFGSFISPPSSHAPGSAGQCVSAVGLHRPERESCSQDVSAKRRATQEPERQGPSCCGTEIGGVKALCYSAQRTIVKDLHGSQVWGFQNSLVRTHVCTSCPTWSLTTKRTNETSPGTESQAPRSARASVREDAQQQCPQPRAGGRPGATLLEALLSGIFTFLLTRPCQKHSSDELRRGHSSRCKTHNHPLQCHRRESQAATVNLSHPGLREDQEMAKTEPLWGAAPPPGWTADGTKGMSSDPGSLRAELGQKRGSCW